MTKEGSSLALGSRPGHSPEPGPARRGCLPARGDCQEARKRPSFCRFARLAFRRLPPERRRDCRPHSTERFLKESALRSRAHAGDARSGQHQHQPGHRALAGSAGGRSRRRRTCRGVERVLAETTVADACLVYRAVRLAQPGGMGEVPDQDLSREPTIALRAVMALAALRDTIALQYANGFREVLGEGLPAIRELSKQASRSRLRSSPLTCIYWRDTPTH